MRKVFLDHEDESVNTYVCRGPEDGNGGWPGEATIGPEK